MQVHSDVPDRRKALIMGIIGGVVAAYVMRWYTRKVVPVIAPRALRAASVSSRPDPLEERALVPRQYEDGESPFQAAGRIVYTKLTGNAPQSEETRVLLGDLAEWAALIGAGAGYGGTRTTTRGRDIAGGFFMGIRLWTADELMSPLLGLRAGPTRYSLHQHIVLLSAYWVYTFVMANLTRVLYRLLP
ncbi:MAG: hypothetical protein IAE80_07150 [Anaerolinea sp.]|nr:hypothetical protein [Anaerolinea sp.]